MWEIKKIQAKSIQTVRDLDLDIVQDVTTLVFGVNNDNLTLKSNGSGKSSILEAIAIATTGLPSKPVRIDEVINNECSKAETYIMYYNTATGEEMHIYRELFKKSANTVRIEMFKDGVPVPDDAFKQSSLAEYKAFIFQKLGISEKDFLGNFIISRHTHKPFFEASDSEKKEIINGLSNAQKVVDPSMDALVADIETASSTAGDLRLNVSEKCGAIDAIKSQIKKVKTENSEEAKQQRLQTIKQNLTTKLHDLEIAQSKLESHKTIKNAVNNMSENIESFVYEGEMEEWLERLHGVDLSGSFDAVSDLVYSVTDIVDSGIKDKKNIANDTERLQLEVSELKQQIGNVDITQLREQCNELYASKSDIQKDIDSQKSVVYNEIAKKDQKLSLLWSETLEIEKKMGIFVSKYNELKNTIAGKIQCPKCKHEFILDSDIDIQNVESEMEVQQSKIKEAESKISQNNSTKDTITEEKNTLQLDIKKISDSNKDRLNDINTKIKDTENLIEVNRSKVEKIESKIISIESNIATHSKKLKQKTKDVSDEVYSEIDRALLKADNLVKSATDHLTYCQSVVETLENNINEIVNMNVDSIIVGLEDQLKELQLDKEKFESQLSTVSDTLDDLKKQQVIFTEFKTHLANSKIEALAFEINDFLSRIKSGLRVKISGYTKTKSGKINEKISISVVRDGVDFGSIYKLSEGEKSMISLATILARQKLINMSADDGGGLNFLAVDEVLDAIDWGGLSSIFDVLNEVGVTSIIISHGSIMEGYPHVMKVVKTNGISKLCKK